MNGIPHRIDTILHSCDSSSHKKEYRNLTKAWNACTSKHTQRSQPTYRRYHAKYSLNTLPLVASRRPSSVSWTTQHFDTVLRRENVWDTFCSSNQGPESLMISRTTRNWNLSSRTSHLNGVWIYFFGTSASPCPRCMSMISGSDKKSLYIVSWGWCC